MANLKEVKTRISSVISTQQITKAMKMVAAAKLRKAQDNIMQMRPYAQKLGEVLENVSSGLEAGENTFASNRDDDKILIVAITSDRGLCGPFNSNVFKTVVELIHTKYEAQEKAGDLQILTIGRKSTEFFKKRKYNVIDEYADVFSNLSFEKARVAAEFVMKGFSEEKFDKVELVYNEFKNIATQVLRTEQLLPLQEASNDDSGLHNDFIYQPNQQVLVDELIPKSLKVQFYKAILESNASEHGARMTAMDKATENADEILKDLRLTYNQTRQAAITKEILEIVAGAEALG
ncbi:MAG: ATP synthase F1 subunit gamma [Bacteroidetes bacterium]|nr:MAG: ATP synthase F1 subunit gamma [Bacteroidota bacterium]